ncbi:FecR family protein [Flagellimonas taeanensis]|uniref:FecR family protein n=1 Tax=Flagellimonas taeanensis TaxID=1005926 RepID=A0A1M6UTC0_9FLAO|nr:FecR domain-containing protein [Allomuricauda taeanensis]SFC53325.1 FecR family protein [Allomuricauda taeanensis]SHK72460.1 FecR family protein [Allomuricauda taeanensis]
MEVSKEDIKCVRKLSGELDTAQERSMFEVNLLLDDNLKERFQDYKLLWECYPKPSLPLRKGHFAKRVLEEISQEPKSKLYFLDTKIKTLLAIAAAVLVGFGVFVFTQDKESRYTNHIIALEGERKQVTLPDGSLVTVNANSELKYPEVFTDDKRNVWMEGEIYFAIVKDVDRPFTVSTNGLEIQVLGTKFNVNTKGMAKTVSLEIGKVQVTLEDSGDKIQLRPNEELSWNVVTGEVVKRNFDVSKTTAWKDNILMLHNLTLEEALPTISEFYGTKFIVSDSVVANKRINAAFENQDLEQFVQTLEFIADVKISKISSKIFSIAPSDEK